MTDNLRGKNMLIKTSWREVLISEHSQNETRAANILDRNNISPQQTIDLFDHELIARATCGPMKLNQNNITHIESLLTRFDQNNNGGRHFTVIMPR